MVELLVAQQPRNIKRNCELGVQIFDYSTGEIQEFDIGSIAVATGSGIIVGGLLLPKATSSTVTVTRWGDPGLKGGQWVMIGARTA